MATKRPFSAIFDKYKTYNPTAEGYGSVKDWGTAFNERMGIDEAKTVLGEDNPLTILGLTALPSTIDELRIPCRKLVKIYSPDNGSSPDADKFQKIIAAFTALENKIKRG